MSEMQVQPATIQAEYASFKKRNAGHALKGEQLSRQWPIYIEQKIFDRTTGNYHIYRNSSGDLPSISELQRTTPTKIVELLGPEDFEEVPESELHGENKKGQGKGKEDKGIVVQRSTLKPIRRKKRTAGKGVKRAQFKVGQILYHDLGKTIGAYRISAAQKMIDTDGDKQELSVEETLKALALPAPPVFSLIDFFEPASPNKDL